MLTLGAPASADEEGVAASITLPEDEGDAPTYDGPTGMFRFEDSSHGELYAWSFDLSGDYTVIDVHIPGGLFDVERMQQVRPSVNVSDQHFPLFHFFPRDDLWDADEPAHLYRFIGDGDPRRGTDGGDALLRLGFKGPSQGTFLLERDVEPPGFALGNVTDLDHFSFFQQTRTDELAIGELHIRENGTEAFRVHPTPSFALQQNFPIQGLDPETLYEVQVNFHDWSGNHVTSPVYNVTTTARPVAPAPTISPLSPPPDATGLEQDIIIRATIHAPTPQSLERVRLFVDLTEIQSGTSFDGTTLTYGPLQMDDGPHKVLVEVYDVYGNRHHEQWTFHVGSANEESSPAIGIWLPGLLLLGWAIAWRGRD